MKKSELTIPQKHQLNVAYKTLKMPDAILGVIGGMTKEEAREVIKRLTGKAPKEESMSKAQTVLSMLEGEDDQKPKEITAIYDSGDKYADRYSVLIATEPSDVSRSGLVMGFSMSTNPDHPQGVSQWGEFRPGKHLGKKIKWTSLPDNVRKHVIRRLKND